MREGIYDRICHELGIYTDYPSLFELAQVIKGMSIDKRKELIRMGRSQQYDIPTHSTLYRLLKMHLSTEESTNLP